MARRLRNASGGAARRGGGCVRAVPRVIDAELLLTILERVGLSASVLERVAGDLGAEARRLAAERRPAAAERAQRLALELARVSSPVPLTVRVLHPQWRDALLTDQPEARALLAVPSLRPAAVWLARRAFVSVPTRAPTAPEVADGCAQLRRWGADALALALVGQDAARAAALAQLGTAAEELRAAVARLRDGATGELARRAALRACKGVSLSSSIALELIGVAAAAPQLAATPLRWRRLCYFVPRQLGLALAAHL